MRLTSEWRIPTLIWHPMAAAPMPRVPPVLGGSAATIAADKVVAKARKIAAHALEAAEDDIEFADGFFRVVGTDRAVSLKDVAQAAYVPSRLPPGLETGLYEVASFSPEIPNFPNGCHVCEVEIDPETGATRVLRYVVVDDVGTVINPLTLAGQIHGGVVQGIGQAFTEHLVYDERSGQLLTGSFMDYGLPCADEVCSRHAIFCARRTRAFCISERRAKKPSSKTGALVGYPN